MRISTRTRSGRAGFTLVELLVAAALSILIMAVLSTAFQTGLQTLSTLKSLGDMAERLKTAETLLRTDLSAEHFANDGKPEDSSDGSPGFQRVSDLRYELQLLPVKLTSPPPKNGYFQIVQGTGSFFEKLDADGLLSSSADGNQNHRLSMTVKRSGRTLDQLVTADLSSLAPYQQAELSQYNKTDILGTNRFVTQWAQVDWFLDQARPAVLNGVTTWPLIRRSRAVGAPCPFYNVTSKSANGSSATLTTDIPHGFVVNNTVLVRGVDMVLDGGPYLITAVPNSTTFVYSIASPSVGSIACGGRARSWTMNVADSLSVDSSGAALSLQDLASGNRFLMGPNAQSITGTKVGDDIVITNVLSFEVRPMYTIPALSPPSGVFYPVNLANPDGVFTDLPQGSTRFDTALDPSIPAYNLNRIRVLAVQVKIRVYDPKNKLTRQTTLVVKL